MISSHNEQKTLKDSHMKIHTSDGTDWQFFLITPPVSDWRKLKVIEIKNLRYQSKEHQKRFRNTTKRTFTFSKPTIKTLEKSLKYVQS